MASTSRRPVVFLDRDGTLIVEKHYLSDPNEVELESSVAEGLKALQMQGYVLVVVSNQSGIGRGKFSAQDAQSVNSRIDELLLSHGVHISGWYVCPHAPEQTCNCRKPLPGMAIAAAKDLGLELGGSYVIGDKRIDIELADAIGGTGILVTTGHGLEDKAWAVQTGRPIFSALADAAAYILERDGVLHGSPSLRSSN